jgi:hypothetical protein
MDWTSFGIGVLAGMALIVAPGAVILSKIASCVPVWR